MIRSAIVGVVVVFVGLSCVTARADDADVARPLKERGVVVTESKGVVSALNIADGKKLSDDDVRSMTRLGHLKMMSISDGLDNARLAQLATLPELEYLQTNLAQVTDDGIKPLAGLKSLRNLKFFHPGKAFTGAGLAQLAGLPQLERLTVAGSLTFDDSGMAAVATLPHLAEFRTWHAGATNAGVQKLRELKTLTSLTLGQRLTYKGDSCPNDETIPILADIKSLESLQLEEARLSLAALVQLRRLPALKKLKLAGIDLPKDDVERLRRELPAVQIEWSEPNETYRRRITALFGK